LYAMFYMHPRNSEILAPVIRVFGNKDQRHARMTDQY
jgi:hypothetical protein